MKTFSKIILMCMTFAALAIVSCKKEDPDPCENVTCQNGGSCNNGSCSCATGYEGATCGTEQRAKFIGSFSASESCTSGNYNYSFTVSNSGTGVSNVVLTNFGGVTGTLSATISGSSITIPSQTIDVTGVAVTFSGSGQISGNIMTISYTLSANGGSDPCTATCTKN
ncbi:MAG: calcium-binding EGF-like domain-containing protein [Flavobacteriales bacterium]|nr:calcium-binding EGF-like domain-containing protein [Flavobacteriales bacterium]